MRVDLVAVELLDHPLRLVQTQKLGDADTHKGGEVGVLELAIDFPNGLAQVLHLLHQFVHVLSVGQSARRTEERVEHGPELARELRHLGESLLHDGGKLEEA